MEIGMIGLGRMGSNMVRRLLRHGHSCAVYDRDPRAAESMGREGALACSTLEDLVAALAPPRAVWMMVPAAAVGDTVAQVAPLLARHDSVIDGGNSNFADSMQLAEKLRAAGIHFIDVGTSGGIWGLECGYCLMIGGEQEPVARLDPIFRALAPGVSGQDDDGAAAGRAGTAAEGYLHCGASGAGHFVKMVHNGIEYGMMAAYAEGMSLLRAAGGPPGAQPAAGALLTSSLDTAAIAQVWRRGSVVRSWLLDLIAQALDRDPQLAAYRGHVGDSGEGRWTVKAGVDAGVPVPVLSAALFARFSSRGNAEFADKVLSAMRAEFGGHREPGDTDPGL
jgi:6-phosphogluconate dehydrogenase